MTDLAHASKLKEHDDNDDFQGTTGRAAYTKRSPEGHELIAALNGCSRDLMKELTVRLMERMLGAELTEHLGGK